MAERAWQSVDAPDAWRIVLIEKNRDFIMLYTLKSGARSAIKSRFCLGASLTIQPPYPKVQIRRKGHPKQVRQIQVSGRLRYFVKLPYHEYNEHPQKQYPEKREQAPFEVEEENRPQEVYDKLIVVNHQGVGFRFCTGI